MAQISLGMYLITHTIHGQSSEFVERHIHSTFTINNLYILNSERLGQPVTRKHGKTNAGQIIFFLLYGQKL